MMEKIGLWSDCYNTERLQELVDDDGRPFRGEPNAWPQLAENEYFYVRVHKAQNYQSAILYLCEKPEEALELYRESVSFAGEIKFYKGNGIVVMGYG
ncbi:hypothetical protein FWF93_02665 [Candidatus Saccharibacteria bacterium]|nr:hypothetical protein [Candidatus Saccharibacteria bacterium]